MELKLEPAFWGWEEPRERLDLWGFIAWHSGRCAVCERPVEAMDHEHTTGNIRGLLCQMCNTFEGSKKGLFPFVLVKYRMLPPASHLIEPVSYKDWTRWRKGRTFENLAEEAAGIVKSRKLSV